MIFFKLGELMGDFLSHVQKGEAGSVGGSSVPKTWAC